MDHSGNEPDRAIRLAPLAAATWTDIRRSWRSVVLFELIFKAAEAVVVVPTVAAFLAFMMARSGRVAISNWDILDFLLTPLGVLYACVLVTAAVAVLLVEQAAIMAIAASPGTPIRSALSLVGRAVAKLVRLGATKASLLALSFAPFVVAALLAYYAILSGKDLYFLWTTRPTEFWIFAGIGGAITLAALAIGTTLFIRWSFAIPIVLFESHSAFSALKESRNRVRGAAWRIGSILIGWQLLIVLVGNLLLLGFRFAADAAIQRSGESNVGLMVGLIIAHCSLVAFGSMAAVIGQSILTLRLYRARTPSLVDTAAPEAPTPRKWYIALIPTAVFVVGAVLTWKELEVFRTSRPPVKVTAHRGHARAAPENTLSAIRRAIESGADYAEIDVQRTADGAIVLLHDRDFVRVSGDPRRLTDMTLDQIRELDVGRWFSHAFVGERAPTLAEVIDLARGKIKLNIELKLYGPDDGLARGVAELIREKGIEAECLVTSFDVSTLAEVKRIAPGARTGLIVAHALGDASRLDVDVLNVQVDHLTEELLRNAHRRGREVHVWTVNEPRLMLKQIKRGVDNILTSDPDLLIQIRGEWDELSGPDRLILSTRLLLGLEP